MICELSLCSTDTLLKFCKNSACCPDCQDKRAANGAGEPWGALSTSTAGLQASLLLAGTSSLFNCCKGFQPFPRCAPRGGVGPCRVNGSSRTVGVLLQVVSVAVLESCPGSLHTAAGNLKHRILLASAHSPWNQQQLQYGESDAGLPCSRGGC